MDLYSKLNLATSNSVIKVLLWLFFAAVFSVLTILLLYLFNFHSTTNISKDPAAWGQFGDYVGGILNPVLAFITLIGLFFTIILQGKQLENSRIELDQAQAELELTRKELRRQANANARTAQLSTINLLIDHYRREIASHSGTAMVATDPRLARLNIAKEREQRLSAYLDTLYIDVLSPDS